ncbi:MAG: site-specific integrase, partial [Candidatus Marinimicrobia bacterium]|nr:site-specific integrase [Candidatus Neomarinimicrobiota bacterium]
YFMQEMKRYYPNPVTLNIRLRSIRAFLRWAVEFEKIERLPFTIKQLKVDSKMPRYFSDSELKTIFDAMKGNDILFARVKLHLNTGMRLRELYTSYFDNGFIHIYKSKGGQERQIPVDAETAYYYEFSKKQKLTDNHISRLFKDILEDLNLYRLPDGGKRSFHCLRHTFAVKTYYETRDIYYVCKLLGHHSVVMTEIYARFSMDKLQLDFCNSESMINKQARKKSEKTTPKHETQKQYALAN